MRLPFAKTCWHFVVGLLLLAGKAHAQAELPFFLEAINVPATAPPGQTRVDLYVAVPYQTLQFLQVERGFRATYNLQVEIYRLEGADQRRFVRRAGWQRQVAVTDFAATRSAETRDLSMYTFNLAPGRYELVVQLEDLATRRLLSRTLEARVRSLDASVALSDPLLLDRYDSTQQAMVPHVGQTVSTDRSSLPVFYELAVRQPQRVQLVHELVRPERRSGWPLIGPLLGIGRGEEYRVIYQHAVWKTLTAGSLAQVHTIPLPEGLEAGAYLLRIRALNPEGEELAVVEKPFTAVWSGLLAQVQDLDEAIEQLRYIAKQKDIDYIKAGKTPEERWQRFLSFWKKRDPTPGTPRNEQMEEFYYRVALANRKFGGRRPGWQTDRGHIVVLFGEPDFVERRDGSQPLEIWHYQRLGRRFIFIDRTGRGDFELLEPIWESPSRIR
jgi:GWxTD domain-containing protein